MNIIDLGCFVHDNELSTHSRIGISFCEGKAKRNKPELTVNEEELLITRRKITRVFAKVFGGTLFFTFPIGTGFWKSCFLRVYIEVDVRELTGRLW